MYLKMENYVIPERENIQMYLNKIPKYIKR